MSTTGSIFDIFGVSDDPRAVTAELPIVEKKFNLVDGGQTELQIHATRITKLDANLTNIKSTGIKRLTVKIAGATLVFASSEAASRFAREILGAVDTTGPFDRSATKEPTEAETEVERMLNRAAAINGGVA